MIFPKSKTSLTAARSVDCERFQFGSDFRNFYRCSFAGVAVVARERTGILVEDVMVIDLLRAGAGVTPPRGDVVVGRISSPLWDAVRCLAVLRLWTEALLSIHEALPQALLRFYICERREYKCEE